MRRLMRFFFTLVMVGLLGALLAQRIKLQATNVPVPSMLPDLPDYRQIEGDSLIAYVGALGEGAALLGAQPQLAAGIAAIDQVFSCYQDLGAVQSRLYSHRQRPLSAGAVAVVDLDTLLDPQTLLACAGPELLSQESTASASGPACLSTYAFSNEDGRFRILVAGSTDSVCYDLCSQMSGCSIADLGIAPVE